MFNLKIVRHLLKGCFFLNVKGVDYLPVYVVSFYIFAYHCKSNSSGVNHFLVINLVTIVG